MSRALERVLEQRRRLTTEVTRAFDAAHAVEEPAGGSPEWLVCCERWGVTPVDDIEREQIRKAQRPTRGAPVLELDRVLREISRVVRVETTRIDPSIEAREADGEQERLLRLTERVVDEVVTAYRGAVLPKAQGMFGNVFAHHGGAQASASTGAASYSLRCKTCGAPRMKSDDFQCAFCDGPMV